MRLILQALLLRTFMNVSKTAFAAETHWHGEETEDGSINVSELSVRYQPNDSDVLREVDLKISNGEFIYVGGLNGAGKTTLLRVLAGYIPRIAGEYRGTLNVCGRNLENLSLRDISKQIRFVPSDPLASIIGLTVGQEMAMLSITEGEAKACLEAMRVAHLWSRESTTLSGGEQVRLVLAGVLASDVKVLLLDAPLEQLDPNGRREFLEALETLRARSKKTIVITDPFFEDLRRNIDRFVLIENGRITENLDIDKVDDRILSRAGLKKESFTLELASVQSNQVAAKLDKVEVVLDGNPILRGVTLEIAPAECAVVMGPNGSGKTTAMLTLAGAITPTSGSVMSAGRVGYVYQDSALQLVEITTRAELALGPRLIKWSESRIDKFVEEGLQWSGLSGDELSIDLTPSKTRLLTIPAMNVDVQVMILDEPTLALDEVNVRKVVGFVESLLRVGVAVFIITHDQSLAKIASRIIEVDAGRIVRESVIVAY
jgi:energy-coupling factor transport system ATP-binding protein